MGNYTTPLQAARNRRRRTPVIRRAVYTGSSGLTVEFDRDMDQLRDDAVFRTLVDGIGVTEFTDFTWSDARTLTSSTGTLVTATYDGPARTVYLSGNLRTKGQFPLPQAARGYRTEASP